MTVDKNIPSTTEALIFADIEYMEQGFGHLFVTSSSSHFFNKTDLEQYLTQPGARLVAGKSQCRIGCGVQGRIPQLSKVRESENVAISF